MNTFNANLFASVRLDRGFLLAMVKQQKGVIVHISSIQRKLPGNMTITYSAAKATLTNYGINKSCVGFPYLFFPDFVATYGQQKKHFELSMNAMEKKLFKLY